MEVGIGRQRAGDVRLVGRFGAAFILPFEIAGYDATYGATVQDSADGNGSRLVCSVPS